MSESSGIGGGGSWDAASEYLELLKLSLMDLLGRETLTARRRGPEVEIVPLEERERRLIGRDWPANAGPSRCVPAAPSATSASSTPSTWTSATASGVV